MQEANHHLPMCKTSASNSKRTAPLAWTVRFRVPALKALAVGRGGTCFLSSSSCASSCACLFARARSGMPRAQGPRVGSALPWYVHSRGLLSVRLTRRLDLTSISLIYTRRLALTSISLIYNLPGIFHLPGTVRPRVSVLPSATVVSTHVSVYG